MTDDEHPLSDDELAALLRRVGDDRSLRSPDRERARTDMLAEFDSIVADSGSAGSERYMSVVPASGLDGGRDRTLRRSRTLAWSAAAALVAVLTLVVVTSLRDAPATTDSPEPTVPRTPVTLPDVEAPTRLLTTESPPVALGNATYRSDEILDGITFGGADGLQLVALRPGLVVMDSVSAGGDLRGRITVFEAEQGTVADTIDAARTDGHVQVAAAQFTASDRALQRQDVTVTADGVADLGCEGQQGCLPFGDTGDEFDPSIWARSENFLVEAWPGAPSVFVLVQTKAFSDPLLNQAFVIIDSLRLE